MSLDLDWDRLTGGPDGEALAESIRVFIDDRFQRVTLPKMIRSVKVHSFEFGSVAPELELKDVCDPLPDFYEDDEDDGPAPTSDDSPLGLAEASQDAPNVPPSGNEPAGDVASSRPSLQRVSEPLKSHRPSVDTNVPPASNPWSPAEGPKSMMSRSSTPGIPGGTSNMSYFHLPLSAGLGGSATPFGAFAGPHSWLDQQYGSLHHHDMSHAGVLGRRVSLTSMAENTALLDNEKLNAIPEEPKEHTTEDVQIVAHVRYAGDVKLCLTADILLDYPMPSFVGIPLQLRVTGMTFDGIAIAAYIKQRAHFCFLSPEDAHALTGGDQFDSGDEQQDEAGAPRPLGALFEDIRVESEIGRRASGKQVLKNVSKVEKFVLEQVRRIFETEFVYPSFWTFLV